MQAPSHTRAATLSTQQQVFERDPCGSRTLASTKAQSEEASKALASKGAGLQRLQKQLEEKTHECGALSRQLQDALEDAQRQVDTPVAVETRQSWCERFPPAGGKQHAEGSG